MFYLIVILLEIGFDIQLYQEIQLMRRFILKRIKGTKEVYIMIV